MHTDPMIAVADVEKSSTWYQKLLGCRSAHGGPHFEILAHESNLLLMLHKRDADEHEFLASAQGSELGRGCALYFHVDSADEIEAVRARADEIGAQVVAEAHTNDQAGQIELELRDPDGYFITVCYRGKPMLS